MDVPDGFPATAAGRAEFAARLMDEAIEIPVIGIKIGLDPILNLVPGAGDVVGALIGVYIVLEGVIAGVPWYVLLLMIGLLAVDVAIGLLVQVPVVGWLVQVTLDAVWKANKWNAGLIRRFA